jgi:hypothetical protein
MQSTPRSFCRALSILCAALAFMSCRDITPPRTPTPPANVSSTIAVAQLMANYVALGTSNSEGVQSAGIFAAAQKAAWPAQLAKRAGVPFSVPLIQDPGCGPPLFSPLATNMVLVGAFGGDLVTAVMKVCAPLATGVVLPASNLAVSGAKAKDALHQTIENTTDPRKVELLKRILLPGQTQVTAMRSKRPTFVSVELAANEVLRASSGRFSAATPYAQWQPVYDSILTEVKNTGAAAVLVGNPTNAANFPSIRKSREFFNQWAYLATLGISVSWNCYYSSNYLFIPGYILTLLSKPPTTATCADVPGTEDYVITPSDMNAINSLMAQMNAHIQAKATENGWAYFALSAVYDLPKPSLNMYNVLFSSTPFGPNISLDGVHPSAQGQALLAAAAAKAINEKYGTAIP